MFAVSGIWHKLNSCNPELVAAVIIFNWNICTKNNVQSDTRHFFFFNLLAKPEQFLLFVFQGNESSPCGHQMCKISPISFFTHIHKTTPKNYCNYFANAIAAVLIFLSNLDYERISIASHKNMKMKIGKSDEWVSSHDYWTLIQNLREMVQAQGKKISWLMLKCDDHSARKENRNERTRETKCNQFATFKFAMWCAPTANIIALSVCARLFCLHWFFLLCFIEFRL